MSLKLLGDLFETHSRSKLKENFKTLSIRCDDASYWKDESLGKFCSLLGFESASDFSLDFDSFIRTLPFETISLTDEFISPYSNWLKANESSINGPILDEMAIELRTQLSVYSQPLASSAIPNPDSSLKQLISLVQTKSGLSVELQSQKQAITIGEQCLQYLKIIRDALSNAYDWSMWDMLGGSPKSTALKIQQLELANTSVIELQLAVQKLEWYLEVIKKSAQNPLRINIADFKGFSDRFFDAFVSDLIRLECFPTTIVELDKLDDELKSTIDYLRFGVKASESVLIRVEHKISDLS